MSAVFAPGFFDRIGLYTTPLAPGMIKVVAHSLERACSCVLTDGEQTWKELYNVVEPFDFRNHVFLLPEDHFPSGTLRLTFCSRQKRNSRFFAALGDAGESEVTLPSVAPVPEDQRIPEADNGLAETVRRVHPVCDGIEVIESEGQDKNGAPMHWFTLFAAPDKATFAAGTPHDGVAVGDVIQTVEGQALAARANGKNVVAAANSDFFDMFGDCVPSGLCVKDGVTVCRGDTERPFFGVTDRGDPVIASYASDPALKGHIVQAVGGLQRLIRNGEIYETNLSEPFCFDRHPRTAVGIKPDHTVVILVVDGRLPPHSNGATLYDMALLLKKEGVKEGLNLDGGGSSTILTWDGEKFNMLNLPVDAARPGEVLVREVYNTLQVIAK